MALIVLMGEMAAVPVNVQTPTDHGQAVDVLGMAERRVAKNPERWTPLAVNDLVPADSAVRTGANAAVLLSLPGQHVIRIGENTMLEIKEIGQNRSYSFALLKGRIWSFVDKASKPTKYEVETASVILGVSGTVFSIARDEQDDELDASVEDGQVRLRRGKLEKTLDRGLQLRVLRNRFGIAIPRMQSKATLAMWKSVGTAESWSKPKGRLRLNKEVEERARAVRAERQAEKGAGRRGGRGRGRRG